MKPTLCTGTGNILRLIVKTLLLAVIFCCLLSSFAAAQNIVAYGLDASERPTLTQYRAIHNAGYSFIGRYIKIPGGNKVFFVTKKELKDSKVAKVGMFLIFEWCSSRRELLPDDMARGYKDGKIAQVSLKELGLSQRTVVYFSLDRVPKIGQGAVDYFTGVKYALGTSDNVGCYGSKAQLQMLERKGLISYKWYAPWMDGNNISPEGWGVDMWQRTSVIHVGGIHVDTNKAFEKDIGLVN